MNLLKGIFIVFMLAVCGVQPSHASDMSLTAYGNLNFGVIEPGRDATQTVIVSVVNAGFSSYSIESQVISPIRNDQGQSLGNLGFYVIDGSNTYGTTHSTSEGPVGHALLYSSDADGTSDSITIAYIVHGGETMAPGTYRGVIRYSAYRPGDSLASDYADLDVTVEIQQSGIEVSVAAISSKMVYGSGTPTTARVNVNFNNGDGRTVKVTQKLMGLPQTTTGKTLGVNAVKFRTVDKTNGQAFYTTPTSLSTTSQVIYQANSLYGGLGVVFEFASPDIENQFGGVYTTTIEYQIEWAGQIYTNYVQLQIEVLSVFQLIVNGGSISFGKDLTASTPNKEVSLTANIKSNKGVPYKVTYSMPTGLMHTVTGQPLVIDDAKASNELLQFKCLKTSGDATVAYPSYVSAVRPTAVNVLTSTTGASSAMTMTYRLDLANAKSGIRGGDYRTAFVLTLIQD